MTLYSIVVGYCTTYCTCSFWQWGCIKSFQAVCGIQFLRVNKMGVTGSNLIAFLSFRVIPQQLPVAIPLLLAASPLPLDPEAIPLPLEATLLPLGDKGTLPLPVFLPLVALDSLVRDVCVCDCVIVNEYVRESLANNSCKHSLICTFWIPCSCISSR